MLAGEAKATKTWFAMELACAIASGTRAFGEFETTQGRVAMLLTEDTQASALRRIRALLLHRGLSEAKVREAMGNIYILCRKRARVTDNEDLAVFVARCLMIEPALVVTDPLANLHQEEENDAVAMSAVAERFMWIRDIVSCSVLLIHHSGKRNEMTGKLRGGQRMRGSSAMHGHVEFGFYFLDTDTKEAPHSWVNVIETETKDGPSLGTFTVKLDVEDGPTGGAVKAVFGYSREVADVQEGDDRRLLNILDGYWRRARDAGASPEPLAYKRLATEAGMSHRNAKKLLEERLVPAGLVTKVLDKRGQPKGFVIVPRETVGAGVVKQ